MSSSGQDTDTIQDLTERVEILEGVNRAIEREQRSIRCNAMHLENVVATIWRATMGPIPTTPDTPAPAPAPAPDPMPRPRPPVPRPPAQPTKPAPTPPTPPKPPTGAKNRVSEAFNSLRGHFGW